MPLAISFNAAFSNSASASGRFSVEFSRSSSFNRLASSALRPPNWFTPPKVGLFGHPQLAANVRHALALRRHDD